MYNFLLAYLYDFFRKTGQLKFVRILSILLNIGLISIFVGLWVADGELPSKPQEIFMMLYVLITPIVSLVVILGIRGAGNSESWLNLLVERKKMEEKSKLAKLKNRQEEKA